MWEAKKEKRKAEKEKTEREKRKAAKEKIQMEKRKAVKRIERQDNKKRKSNTAMTRTTLNSNLTQSSSSTTQIPAQLTPSPQIRVLKAGSSICNGIYTPSGTHNDRPIWIKRQGKKICRIYNRKHPIYHNKLIYECYWAISTGEYDLELHKNVPGANSTDRHIRQKLYDTCYALYKSPQHSPILLPPATGWHSRRLSAPFRKIGQLPVPTLKILTRKKNRTLTKSNKKASKKVQPKKKNK